MSYKANSGEGEKVREKVRERERGREGALCGGDMPANSMPDVSCC